MFLIILGHNAVFTNSLKGSFNYLYTFHVLCFFVLPFMYGKNEQKPFKQSFKKNFIRLYYPFILFFTILSLLSYFTGGNEIDLNKISTTGVGNNNYFIGFTSTLITGNKYLIDHFTSFQYLWFLPVMFSMNLIKETISNKKIIKVSLYILGCVSYIIFFVFSNKTPYNRDINFYLMKASPFAILQGLGAYFLGRTSVAIINNKYCKYINLTSSLLFILLSIIYITDLYNNTLSTQKNWCYTFIMPFLFINLIFLTKDYLAKSNILKRIGEHSLPIYLIHPPLCIVSYMICQKFLQINLTYAIVIQILVLTVSYYIAVLWNKITPLRKKTLPRSFEDLYCKKN